MPAFRPPHPFRRAARVIRAVRAALPGVLLALALGAAAARPVAAQGNAPVEEVSLRLACGLPAPTEGYAEPWPEVDDLLEAIARADALPTTAGDEGGWLLRTVAVVRFRADLADPARAALAGRHGLRVLGRTTAGVYAVEHADPGDEAAAVARAHARLGAIPGLCTVRPVTIGAAVGAPRVVGLAGGNG